MRSRALNLAALALLTGLCGSIGGALQPAAAQQLDAGKPPAQIFAGTCAACHRSPRGLVKSVSPGSLPSFLRQHYTTGNDMAGTMASFVLGNGGTQQMAEPPAKQEKREPRAKSEGQDVAARTPATDPAAHSKTAKQQKAGKKGQVQPAATPEPEKPEVAKPETPATTEPPKPEIAATDCKVEPAKQAEDSKAGEPGAPPRQPAALLTLPGFPAPEPEPEAEAEAAKPGCEPGAPVTTAAHADTQAGEHAKEQPKEPAKEQPKEQPPALAEPPKTEPLRATVTEAPLRASVAEPPLRATATETPPSPSLDIMREEVHAPRVVRTGQKKRAPPPQ